MITSNTAAGLVFGMLQGSDCIGQVIDQLSEQECDVLLQSWKGILAGETEGPAQEIIKTIEEHPALSVSWAELSYKDQECRRRIIEIIKANIEDRTGNGIS